MEGYIAEVRMFGGNFAPRGWAFCNGAILPIAQYDALFALIGTTYGGDGQTTFALPNLASRVPIGTGSSAFGTFVIGQMSGTENNTLLTTQLPAHSHTLTGTIGQSVSGEDGHNASPANAYPAVNGDNIYSSASSGVSATANNGLVLGVTGGSQPYTNVKPYLSINYIICLEGIFPSRN